MNFEKHFYGEREVIIFVDEAGDPSFRDPGNPLFLFGACIATGKTLEQEIRLPWLGVRESVLGDKDRPIHMREIGRRLRDHQLESILEFFANASFKRVSFCVTEETLFELGDIPRAPVLELSLEFLLRSAAELTFGDSYVDGFSIVFEQGPLAEKLKKFWPPRRMNRKDGDGVISSVPVNWAILAKEANEPGLEIADFIAHTAAGYARATSKEKFETRFRAVFPADRSDLSQSLRLDSAILSSPANATTSGPI